MSTYAPADLDYLAFLISGVLSDQRDEMPSLAHIDIAEGDIVGELPALLDILATRTRERRTVELTADRGPGRTCRHCGDKIWLDGFNGSWFDARSAWVASEQCPAVPGQEHQPTDQES